MSAASALRCAARTTGGRRWATRSASCTLHRTSFLNWHHPGHCLAAPAPSWQGGNRECVIRRRIAPLMNTRSRAAAHIAGLRRPSNDNGLVRWGMRSATRGGAIKELPLLGSHRFITTRTAGKIGHSDFQEERWSSGEVARVGVVVGVVARSMRNDFEDRRSLSTQVHAGPCSPCIGLLRP